MSNIDFNTECALFIASLGTAAVTEYLANARVLNDEVAVMSKKRHILNIGQLPLKWFRAAPYYPMTKRYVINSGTMFSCSILNDTQLVVRRIS